MPISLSTGTLQQTPFVPVSYTLWYFPITKTGSKLSHKTNISFAFYPSKSDIYSIGDIQDYSCYYSCISLELVLSWHEISVYFGAVPLRMLLGVLCGIGKGTDSVWIVRHCSLHRRCLGEIGMTMGDWDILQMVGHRLSTRASMGDKVSKEMREWNSS